MADKIRGISAAQPISFPRTKGTRNPRMISHAVSTVSELKKGSSKAVTSDQPVRPSARTSTRTTVRSWVVPKLVSKGDFRRILSLRRVIDSIRMGLQEMNQEFFCNKRCRPKKIRQCLTVSKPKRLVKISKLECLIRVSKLFRNVLFLCSLEISLFLFWFFDLLSLN